MSIASMIDHTLLKQDATGEQIDRLCAEAAEYHFASVCVNPYYVVRCVKNLKGTGVKVCTVVGFPLGATTMETKVFETLQAVASGAEEIDMVINVCALKSGHIRGVEQEIQAMAAAVEGKAILKVIIETCLLTDEEKVLACQIAKRCGADFVKTSTGFSTGGATVEDVALMRRTVGPEMGVKASGGIRDYAKAKAMIDAGASRIGASAGIAIVEAEREGQE
ncbi:MAG: deoxyribose-phosphate aldolase [Clostridiaceae bacterium]|nr:deoxyribose-phosphate aldolase [Clostridia bacterium]MDD7312280.1 deoxyribose-phosphate aldolase [Clostridia bacterium]MDY3870283.1 deoxyribose-phosphate aldolase [Clostridiaceae bacterium]